MYNFNLFFLLVPVVTFFFAFYLACIALGLNTNGKNSSFYPTEAYALRLVQASLKHLTCIGLASGVVALIFGIFIKSIAFAGLFRSASPVVITLVAFTSIFYTGHFYRSSNLNVPFKAVALGFVFVTVYGILTILNFIGVSRIFWPTSNSVSIQILAVGAIFLILAVGISRVIVLKFAYRQPSQGEEENFESEVFRYEGNRIVTSIFKSVLVYAFCLAIGSYLVSQVFLNGKLVFDSFFTVLCAFISPLILAVPWLSVDPRKFHVSELFQPVWSVKVSGRIFTSILSLVLTFVLYLLEANIWLHLIPLFSIVVCIAISAMYLDSSGDGLPSRNVFEGLTFLAIASLFLAGESAAANSFVLFCISYVLLFALSIAMSFVKNPG